VLLGGPVLALVALDRAIVLSTSHWEWVAREVPPLLLDPYRVEGLVRSAAPGPQNVVIVGDSTAEMAFDAERLDRRFAGQRLRFLKLTIGGGPAASYAMLAEPIDGLDPSAVILMVSGPAVRGREYRDHIYTYDVRVVPELFSFAEVFENVSFHVDGLIRQSHVLARHRRALQRVALVRLGQLSWARLRIEHDRRLLAEMFREGPGQRWMRGDEPDLYPNPNTRAVELLARRFGRGGSTFIVVEAPAPPTVRLLGAREKRARFRSYLGELAELHGFSFLSADAFPTFKEDDFEDMVHLNARGRRVFTRQMIQHLRAVL
jgi:hypothetical protein